MPTSPPFGNDDTAVLLALAMRPCIAQWQAALADALAITPRAPPDSGEPHRPDRALDAACAAHLRQTDAWIGALSRLAALGVLDDIETWSRRLYRAEAELNTCTAAWLAGYTADRHRAAQASAGTLEQHLAAARLHSLVRLGSTAAEAASAWVGLAQGLAERELALNLDVPADGAALARWDATPSADAVADARDALQRASVRLEGIAHRRPAALDRLQHLRDAFEAAHARARRQQPQRTGRGWLHAFGLGALIAWLLG